MVMRFPLVKVAQKALAIPSPFNLGPNSKKGWALTNPHPRFNRLGNSLAFPKICLTISSSVVG